MSLTKFWWLHNLPEICDPSDQYQVYKNIGSVGYKIENLRKKLSFSNFVYTYLREMFYSWVQPNNHGAFLGT